MCDKHLDARKCVWQLGKTSIFNKIINQNLSKAMRPRHVVTKEEIETLNTALMMKKYRGKTLAYADINTFLSSFYQNNALKFEILKHVFVRTGRGQYYIPDKPIYIGQLQEVYDTRYNAHLKRQSDRKTHKKDSINIEKAIKLLKENGYHIYKETIDINEALKNPDRTVSEFIRKVKI